MTPDEPVIPTDASGRAGPGGPAGRADPSAGSGPAHPPGCPAYQGDRGAEGAGPVLLGGPLFQQDPARVYRELRHEHGPVAPVILDGGAPAWLVLDYRELHQLTADPVLFSRDSTLWNQWDTIPEDWPLSPLINRGQGSILSTVGERHTRRAAMISDALEEVDHFALKQHTEQFADELIDGFCTDGATDLMARYTWLLPVRVLAKIYGFSDERGPSLVTALRDTTDANKGALAATRYLIESMAALLGEKRSAPGPDIVSRMLRTGGFTEAEIAEDLMVMLAAGHTPTANWIGNSLRLMLTDDRFAASLSGGRHSVAEAMNEVLWEDTPVPNAAGRWATRDTNLGKHHIRSGDMLVLGLAGANNDPQVRTDDSASTGGNNAFMSFGHGEHRCPFPAQEIAEIIARTAIEVLLDRLPGIELSVPAAALTWQTSPWIRGLAELPVTFTPTPVLGPG
jgi:cytochrome P450